MNRLRTTDRSVCAQLPARLERFGIKLAGFFELLALGMHKEAGIIRLIRRTRRERRSLLLATEQMQLYLLAKAQCERVPGAMAGRRRKNKRLLT